MSPPYYRIAESNPIYCASGAPAPDRSKIAQRLIVDALAKSDWSSLQFHFMIDWREVGSPLTGPLIVRYILSTDTNNPSEQDIDLIARETHIWERISSIMAATSRPVLGIVLIDLPVVTVESPIWVLRLSGEGKFIEKQTTAWIRQLVAEFSGPTALMGQKGLKIGMSRSECHLASSGIIFPGDVDALLLWRGRPKLIVEFKSHNIAAPLLAHDVNRYYPRPDARKWNGLKSLAQGLDVRGNVKLAVLYYSTVKDETRLAVVNPTGTSIATEWDSGVTGQSSFGGIMRRFLTQLEVD